MKDASSLYISLPDGAMKELKRRAEVEAKTVEEVVAEATLQFINVKDPAARIELYLGLCNKYLKEAEEFLNKGDAVQASEKAWGATSQIVRALAAKEGVEMKVMENCTNM